MCSFAAEGALREEEAYVITQNFSSLAKDMQDETILDFMMDQHLIDLNCHERISALATRHERIVTILELLLQHPMGYSTLLKALDSDARWMAECLRASMKLHLEEKSCQENKLHHQIDWFMSPIRSFHPDQCLQCVHHWVPILWIYLFSN